MTSYHTRQAYKDRLVQQGHDEAMKNFVMGLIKEAFTSNDPKLLELRSQMFRQAGVVLPQGQAAVVGQMVPPIGGLARYPVNNIVKPTPCNLVVPYGRLSRRQMSVGMGVALPGRMYYEQPIPDDYARVEVMWIHPDQADDEIDIPTPDRSMYLRSVVGKEVLWARCDIYFDESTLSSQPSPSPMGHDYDDGGGNDPASTPRSTPPCTSNP